MSTTFCRWSVICRVRSLLLFSSQKLWQFPPEQIELGEHCFLSQVDQKTNKMEKQIGQLNYKILHRLQYTVDLSPRFFCIDATLLCEFESDKI